MERFPQHSLGGAAMNACLGQSYLTETVQLDRGYKTLFKQRSDWTLSEYSIGAISKYMFYVLFIISGVQGSGLEGGLARGAGGSCWDPWTGSSPPGTICRVLSDSNLEIWQPFLRLYGRLGGSPPPQLKIMFTRSLVPPSATNLWLYLVSSLDIWGYFSHNWHLYGND